MRKRGLIICFLIPAAVLLGQVDANSVTVTASRNANLIPDEVRFNITVTSPLNISLDEVLASLQGSGITSASLSNIYSIGVLAPSQLPVFLPEPAPTIQWSFVSTAPLTKVKETTAMLTSLQQSVPKKNPQLKMSFSIYGTNVSLQAQQAQPCSIPDLITDARAQAQKLTNAAGVNVGAILSMTAPAVSVFPTCAVTVRFALLRF
jgi:hypothetical protein